MGNSPSNPNITEIAHVKVIVTEPEGSPKGVTILLPGSSAPFAAVTVDMYSAISEALVKEGQIVIGYYQINVLSGTSHDTFARRAADVVKSYLKDHPDLPTKYNVVGHSVGAKIALLLAAKVDPQNLNKVLALDPVDDKPPQFTNGLGDNLSLKDRGDRTSIYLTWAAATPTGMFGISPARNALAVYERNKDHIAEFLRQENASHFAYTDTGTGPLISGGTPEGNKAAREEVLELIRQKI